MNIWNPFDDGMKQLDNAMKRLDKTINNTFGNKTYSYSSVTTEDNVCNNVNLSGGKSESNLTINGYKIKLVSKNKNLDIYVDGELAFSNKGNKKTVENDIVDESKIDPILDAIQKRGDACNTIKISNIHADYNVTLDVVKNLQLLNSNYAVANIVMNVLMDAEISNTNISALSIGSTKNVHIKNSDMCKLYLNNSIDSLTMTNCDIEELYITNATISTNINFKNCDINKLILKDVKGDVKVLKLNNCDISHVHFNNTDVRIIENINSDINEMKW